MPNQATTSQEVFYEANINSLAGNSAVAYMYPPTQIYNSNGETLSNYISRSDDRIINVDIAYLKLKKYVDPDQDLGLDGTFRSCNMAGAFFAVEPEDYYYKRVVAGSGTIPFPSLARTTKIPRVGESILLPNGSTGGSFENTSLQMFTNNVGRYDDIEVDGLNEGYKPNGMGALAVRLEGVPIEDVTYKCFNIATIPDTQASTAISGANVITEQIKLQTGRGAFPGVKSTLWQEEENDYVTEKGWVTSDYVSAVEIVNVERDLDDLRYGDEEDDYPFIFTGASHVFTGTEVADNTPVSLTVYGGDCYIGLHTFKITDSNYSLTDPEKLIDGTGAKTSQSDAVELWERTFNKNANEVTPTFEDVSRPIPLKGVSQTVTVLLESEINPEVKEKDVHNGWAYDSTQAITNGNLPVPYVDDAGQIRAKFKYRYNLDYSKENDYRVFFPYKSYVPNITLFEARIPYSDQKIYNSDIEGFDRFRVLSFYDLDETHGAITKIQEAGDKLFAIQESAVSYIPVQAQVIETADGGNMSVRSGEIIGVPIKINTLYGSQHPKTIKADSSSFYFVDGRRASVLAFTGKELQIISDNGMQAYFSDNLPLITDPAHLSAVYDNRNKEYVVYMRETDSAVFSARTGSWTGRYPESASASTLGGLRVGETMMVVGVGGTGGTLNAIRAATLYEGGNIAEWWDIVSTPTINMYINPEPDIGKVFDAFTVVSTRLISPTWFNVRDFDESILSSDLSAVVPKYQQGSFRFKNLRVSHENGGVAGAGVIGGRLQGTYGEIEFNFSTANQSGMTSVLTKYRPLFRPL